MNKHHISLTSATHYHDLRVFETLGRGIEVMAHVHANSNSQMGLWSAEIEAVRSGLGRDSGLQGSLCTHETNLDRLTW